MSKLTAEQMTEAGSVVTETAPAGIPTEEQQRDRHTFERIQEEARSDPDRWPAGQYVGLLGGEVAARSPDFLEVATELRRAEPDRRKGMVFRIGDRYDETERML